MRRRQSALRTRIEPLRCGFVRPNGQPCRQRIRPNETDCGRHHVYMRGWIGPQAGRSGDCRMFKTPTGDWHCTTHQGDQWETARAMGAQPPCWIPTTASSRQELASGTRTWKLGPNTIRLLSNDPTELVRSLLAANSQCPPSVLRRLAQDTASVRGEVLTNATADTEIIQAVVDSLSDDTLAQVVLADGDYLSAAAKEVLARHPSALVRANLLTPAIELGPILDVLVRDADPKVRAQAVAHPQVTMSALRRLAGDPGGLVRAMAAGELQQRTE